MMKALVYDAPGRIEWTAPPHHFPLEAMLEAYAVFADASTGALKVALTRS